PFHSGTTRTWRGGPVPAPAVRSSAHRRSEPTGVGPGSSRRTAGGRRSRGGRGHPNRPARPAGPPRHPELCPAPVDAAAHGPQLHPKGAGDLFIKQALDVAEHDGSAVLRRERGERLLHVAVQMAVVERLGRGRLIAAQPTGRVVTKAL